MKTTRFRKLEVWKRSMDFITQIYKLTGDFPKHEMYGLASQLRRAAISIALNIAEGSGANSDVEFKRFLIIALRSSFEVSCAIDIANNLDYLPEADTNYIETECNEITAMVRGLIKQMKQR